VNEQATHIVDLARYLVDEVESVQAVAQMSESHPDLIGSAAINLHFANGSPGSLLYSCQANEKLIGFRVFTSDEVLTLSGWDFHLVGDDSTKVDHENRNQIFDVEVAAFLEAVAHNSDCVLCSFKDAMQTQHVVDAIHRSVESGKTESVASVG
jgi:predicted dehydrogenase